MLNGWVGTSSNVQRNVISDETTGSRQAHGGCAAEDNRVVPVWKLDRFGGRIKNLIDNILLLDSYGVRFIGVTQGIDTNQRTRQADP